MLKAGDRVPEFQLPVDNGRSVSSADLAGRRYLLYFYPKDDTPGCTVEACSFRDNLPAFDKVGIAVFGVSADDAISHQRFARKHGLNFPLIADPNHQLIGPMGVWVEKSMYGKKYMGIQRSTFLVGSDGIIEKVWENVKPLTHTAEVLEHLGVNVKVKKPAVVEAVKAAVGMVAKAAVGTVASRSKPAPVQPAPKQTAARPVAKKPAAKTAVARKTAAQTPAPKKATKPAVKKTAARKAAPKKTSKPAAKKVAALRKPAVAKKPAAVKKPAGKKSPPKAARKR
jgi:peroxiredoxin Q/BCP